MAQPSDYNLFETETRECPFPYFNSIRPDQRVYFMEELGA